MKKSNDSMGRTSSRTRNAPVFGGKGASKLSPVCPAKLRSSNTADSNIQPAIGCPMVSLTRVSMSCVDKASTAAVCKQRSRNPSKYVNKRLDKKDPFSVILVRPDLEVRMMCLAPFYIVSICFGQNRYQARPKRLTRYIQSEISRPRLPIPPINK